MTTRESERLLPRRVYQGVPEAIGEHYWYNAGVKGNWGVVKPYPFPVVNAALNPSMEAGFDTPYHRWITINGATFLRSPEGAIYGNMGGQIITMAANQGAGYDLWLHFSFNTEYWACISIDGPAGSVATFRFEYGESGITFSTPTVVTLPGYPVRVCTHLSPVPPEFGPTIPSIPISVRFDRAGEYKIDGLVLTTTSEPITEYFDGDSPGAEWTGPAHLSSSSSAAFNRTFGEKVNLNEIGFNITGHTGFGLAPKQLLTSSYARLNGAHLQRVKDNPRVITLSGTFEGSPEEMHEARAALIDALAWRFEDQCTQELLLTYCLRDECGCQLSEEVQIPVMYRGGLEGLWGSLDRERATLVFEANTQPNFNAEYPSSASLNLNGTTIIDYTGTAPAWLEVHMWPAFGGTQVWSIENDTTGHDVFFGTQAAGGNPNALPLAWSSTVSEYAILRTDPAKRITLDLYSTPLDEDNGLPIGGAVYSRIMHYIRAAQSQVGMLRLVPGENQFRATTTGSTGGRVFLVWRNQYKSVDHLCASICRD